MQDDTKQMQEVMAKRTSQNYYRSKKVKMPKPELYVIFTGNKGRKPDKISFSAKFLTSRQNSME